jgi:GIY-YIG catalytic domain-containing protein
MDLPDLYFLFVRRRGDRPLLFHRDRQGRIRAVVAAGLPPEAGALLVHGPGTVAWDPEHLDLIAQVRDGDGAVLPLNAVLARCGLPARGRPEALLQRLGGTRVDIEDPRIEGREILERLAELLGSLDTLEAESPGGATGPRALVVADVALAPDTPGIYTFISSEGRALYVGKARSLHRRLAGHFRSRGGEPAKRAALIEGATEVRWEETGSELEALLREHLALRREHPAINVQRAAHRRPRGALRDRSLALLLPSTEEAHHELCLVGGNGRFHWERVSQGSRVSRGTWSRVVSFLEGKPAGWGPGERKRLQASLTAELAEITLSWLALHGSSVTQIDLSQEAPVAGLKARFTRLMAQDAAGPRVLLR